LPTGHRNW